MASEVLTDAYVMINSVDLSDHVVSLTLPLTTEEIDDTCMGDSSRAYLPGLKGASFDVTFKQDFASSKVDATLWGVYDGGAAVALKVRKSGTDAIATTNPEYQFNVVMTNYEVLNGTVGDSSEVSASFIGTGDVTRDTTP